MMDAVALEGLMKNRTVLGSLRTLSLSILRESTNMINKRMRVELFDLE